MSTRITLTNLTKRFDSAQAAVDNVSLTIEPGELFFLLGPSGCGKTTLLRMIAGFIEPTSGAIAFDTNDGRGQRDVTYLPPNKRNTGMVFQSYALWPHMTVAANVAFGLDVRSIPAAEKQRRITEALDTVQMGQYASRKPNQLSGGQQQRIALARALVIRPEVLLLDEPLSNLDAKLRTELRAEIRRICKTVPPPSGSAEGGVGGGTHGITTVYVTHDQKEALSMADRVAIVNRGRIVQIGPPAELYRRPRNRFVAEFLGETNLIPGKVLERTHHTPPGSTSHVDALSVQTAAGRLLSTQISSDVKPDAANILCSIRPEAFRINTPDGTNTLFARVTEATYLGETAKLAIELQGGIRAHIAMLNPGLTVPIGQPLTVGISPDDVVVLPAD